jgi:hypothetical protein
MSRDQRLAQVRFGITEGGRNQMEQVGRFPLELLVLTNVTRVVVEKKEGYKSKVPSPAPHVLGGLKLAVYL